MVGPGEDDHHRLAEAPHQRQLASPEECLMPSEHERVIPRDRHWKEDGGPQPAHDAVPSEEGAPQEAARGTARRAGQRHEASDPAAATRTAVGRGVRGEVEEARVHAELPQSRLEIGEVARDLAQANEDPRRHRALV